MEIGEIRVRVVDLMRDRVSKEMALRQMTATGYSSESMRTFSGAYDELGTLYCLFNVDNVTVHVGRDAGSCYLYGSSEESEEFDLSFMDWEDWLGFDLCEEALAVFSETELLISCVMEMCQWGKDRISVLRNTGSEQIIYVEAV